METLLNSTTRIEAETRRRILSAAQQAPSAENSQPWRFGVGDCCLEVFHLTERAQLAAFPDDLSLFSLGMIVESIELASGSEGLRPLFSYQLQPRRDDIPWLQVTFERASRQPEPLAAAIFTRHTDRRRYAGGSLQDPVFREIEREAKAAREASLYLVDRYPPAYLQLLQDADQTIFQWPAMRRDLNKWVRFTEDEIQRTGDGLPWRSLLRGPERWWHRLQSQLWRLEFRLDWFPPWLIQLEKSLFDDSGDLTPGSFDDGAGIGCITTASFAPEDLVAAGRLALRVWLRLNLAGYGFQPMTNLTSILYPQQRGDWKLPPRLAHYVHNGYAIVQETFGFPMGETPIFCFRTGLASGSYPQQARTLRRRHGQAEA